MSDNESKKSALGVLQSSATDVLWERLAVMLWEFLSMWGERCGVGKCASSPCLNLPAAPGAKKKNPVYFVLCFTGNL